MVCPFYSVNLDTSKLTWNVLYVAVQEYKQGILKVTKVKAMTSIKI